MKYYYQNRVVKYQNKIDLYMERSLMFENLINILNNNKNINNNGKLDRIKGMIICAALSDALGVPHEFRSSKYKYTGKLEFEGVVPSRWQCDKVMKVGQCSDDTEMSLTLMRSLLKYGYYNKEEVCVDYMYWASGLVDKRNLLEGEVSKDILTPRPIGIGKNTRAIFAGIKTYKGYTSRSKKIFEQGVSRGNGSLMRCHVLSLLPNDEGFTEDCSLSNPDEICLETEKIYIYCLRMCLNNKNKEVIKQYLLSELNNINEEISKYIQNALDGNKVDVSGKTKGYILNGLYCALYALFHFDNYKDAIDYIICLGGDTDTNGCISGALLGCYYGYNNISLEPVTKENINIMLNCTSEITGRPKYYSLDDICDLCEKLSEFDFK